MEKLGPQNRDDLRALQSQVKASLDQPDLLVALTDDEIRQVTSDDTGVTVGVYNSMNELVGIYAVLYPGLSETNIAKHLELDPAELTKVFHLEICFIHPAYRGEGLMVEMCEWLFRYIRLEGEYRYAAITIAPDNIGSLKSALQSENYIMNIEKKYGGLDRFILFRDLLTPWAFEESKTEEVSIKEDRLAPVPWLKQGYAGVAIEKRDDDLVMVMKKPL